MNKRSFQQNHLIQNSDSVGTVPSFRKSPVTAGIKQPDVTLQTINPLENNRKNLPSFELPDIQEERGKTIFNPLNYLSLYKRVVKIKPGAERRWGKMNVVQMLNHLKIATGSGIKVYHLADESSFLSRVIKKFLALRVLKHLPKNIEGPEGFKIEMNHALDFNTEKQWVLNILKKAYASTDKVYPHPMFGTMSRALWGRLIYRHFDHHLRQFGS